MPIFDVRQFGALGDGTSLDTGAIQAAIDACSTAGGGDVLFAAGAYLTGTVELRDGVVLVVEQDARLLGSPRIEDYRTDTFHNLYRDESHMDRCLIYARGATGIGIRGSGVIDGQGGRQNFPNPKDAAGNRPMMIRFVECHDILIESITLMNPAAWTSAFVYCTDIVVQSVGILSRANHNGDGLDFDGCARVRVSDSWFETSDDSICLQSSSTEMPCEDVVIERCELSSTWAGIRVGLLSRGIIRRLTVADCRFRDITDSGIKIQMCEGGEISHLEFRRLRMVNVMRPIFITLAQQRALVGSPPELPPAGVIDTVLFEDVAADAEHPSPDSLLLVLGMPQHPVRNLTLRRVRFSHGGGLLQERSTAVPEFDEHTLGGWWPEYDKLGGPLPASGLFARHVDGLVLDDVHVLSGVPDVRPAIVTQDVDRLVG